MCLLRGPIAVYLQSEQHCFVLYLVHLHRSVLIFLSDSPHVLCFCDRTDEMRPEWFSLTETSVNGHIPTIPYDRMWADDIHWLPQLIKGQRFAGRADIVKDGDGFVMKKFWFGTVLS